MSASEGLDVLIRTNLAASAAILLVLAVRKSARRLVGSRLAYGLWALPVLAAVAVTLPARRVVVEAPLVAATPPVAQVAPIEAAAVDPSSILMGVWFAGAVGVALLLAFLQWRFLREEKNGAIGPAVAGVLAPRIVTPADFAQRYSDEERRLVLAHEEAHIARQDSRLNAASAAIQCLFWFNPLVHLAAHFARIDQEMACDEAVVSRFPEARSDYARTLAKAQLATRPLPLGCYWPSGTEHPLLERIDMLKQDAFGPSRKVAGTLALGLVCAATGLAAWASQPSVTVVASASTKRAGEVPEMMPTGVMLPAYGSHPPGTPRGRIGAMIPEMTPTGALRPVFNEKASLQLLAQPPGRQVTVIERSTLTNSVIHDGEAPAPAAPETSPPRPTVISNPTWERRPTGEELSAVYPERALRLERTGAATLNCVVGSAGDLGDCRVQQDSDPELDFGGAALKLVPYFKMRPPSEGLPGQGERIAVPIRFDLK